MCESLFEAANNAVFFQLLVTHGASVFSENSEKEVPCDVAEKNEHSDVALYLESKMVFSVSRRILALRM